MSTTFYHPPPVVPDTITVDPRPFHSEIPNKWLTVTYVVNMVFALLATILAIGQIIINEQYLQSCVEDLGALGTFFFVMAIIVIIMAVVIIGLMMYALITRSGHTPFQVRPTIPVTVQPAVTPFPTSSLPTIQESDNIVNSNSDTFGYHQGATSELGRFLTKS